MSGDLTWILNRIRRMGGREITFRVVRHIGQVIEKGRISLGWAPKPPTSIIPGKSLLPSLPEYQPLWKQRYGLNNAVLDELTSGSLELFGSRKVKPGDPIDWHLDPVSSIHCPKIYGKTINYRNSALVGNVKVVWELGRQHHLIPLAVAYAVSGEIRYRDAITNQIAGWIDQNPFGIGIHWCSALELGLRLVSWSIIHSLIASRDGDQGLFGAIEQPDKLGTAIYQQAWFIRHYLSRHSSAANHLFGELTGLWIASHVFDMGSDGARWKLEAQNELERELQLQVYSDGVDKEQAFYYHLWMLEYALFLQVAGQRVGSPFSDAFRTQVATMAGFLRDVTPSEGDPPQVGDADDGFVTRFSATWPENPYQDVLSAESLVNLQCIENPLTEKSFWYGIIGGCNNTLKQSNSCTPYHRPYPRVYPAGGYAVLGDNNCHLVFDAGSLGYLSIAGHGHADALSFTLAIDGQWWLVDPGTYIYHSMPEWRNYFRSTRAHNCVVVDNRDQSVMSGPFMWSKHANAHLISYGGDNQDKQWAIGSHDGYQDIGVTHRREMQFHPHSQEICITDEFEGTNSHNLDIWFQFAPNVQVAKQGRDNIWTLTKKNCARIVQMQLDSGFEWEAFKGQEKPFIAGWYSSRLGDREPCYALRGNGKHLFPKRITTSIVIE